MLNPNVKIFYTYTFIQSLGRGIWMGNILSLYIVLLAETATGFLGLTPNELLGVTSAVTGVAMLMSVLPGGILADRWSIKGTLVLAALAASVGLLALALVPTLVGVAVGLFFWGVFQGLSRPAAETMLANSTISGNRSKVYSKAHVLDQLGMGSGPVLNIFLFLILGDRWDVSILRMVMWVGMIFSFISTQIILRIHTQHDLGMESEALGDSATNDSHKKGIQRFIPHVFLASSFIIGFGAGMTVKFFPVFFRSIYGFQPIAVQAVMGAGLLVTGLATALAQRFSLRQGRAEMIVVLQGFAILCLIGMSFYPPVWIMILLFIVRGATMNATTPLSRSIVMDYVPKKRRGVWNSLQSVAWGLFWNVSALLGGFIIGNDRFNRIFLVTAGIYVLGTGIIIPLIPAIHRERA